MNRKDKRPPPDRPPDNLPGGPPDGPPDNYAAFIERMDRAAARLSSRLRSVIRALGAVSLLLEEYQGASLKWERRRARTAMELDRCTGDVEMYTALGELHDTAVKMVALHHGQTSRITEKLHQLQDQRDAIHHSLGELEAGVAKLKASRAASRDRRRLKSALYELSGANGAGASAPDRELLSDLREAREAVVLAEALMEVKGPRP
jgi:phage shock protein A